MELEQGFGVAVGARAPGTCGLACGNTSSLPVNLRAPSCQRMSKCVTCAFHLQSEFQTVHCIVLCIVHAKARHPTPLCAAAADRQLRAMLGAIHYALCKALCNAPCDAVRTAVCTAVCNALFTPRSSARRHPAKSSARLRRVTL